MDLQELKITQLRNPQCLLTPRKEQYPMVQVQKNRHLLELIMYRVISKDDQSEQSPVTTNSDVQAISEGVEMLKLDRAASVEASQGGEKHSFCI
ncbi:Hypp8006 [Branchiostoma lanceolatum]|uniref:Hypp8006 protein n=1 Tax=Branchiostoma lanceolatum TaxID=7740 RepID=A0A8K0EG89_BRALA|nr:Hypp8006 [Branchiostoma lanceolatum]